MQTDASRRNFIHFQFYNKNQESLKPFYDI